MAIDALTTSGINTLVSSFITSEQNKLISPLNTRMNKYQNIISGYSTLSSKLDSLKTVLGDLKATGTSSAFQPVKSATLSNTSYFTASAASTASTGTYTMRVSQLAKSDISVSKQEASTAAKLANGTYKFQVKSGSITKDVTVTIDDTVTDFKSTLKKISEAINKDASDAVTGAVFSPDGTTSRLSMTAKNTGAGNQVVLQKTDDTSKAILEYMGFAYNDTTGVVDRDTVIDDGTGGYIYDASALSARMKFNGIDITRDTNTVSDLAEGITFSLTGEMKDTDSTVNISVTGSTSSLKSKIENFVSKYNESYNYVKTNSSTSTVARGAFAGDATAVSLLRSLSTTAYSKVNGLGADKLSRLSDIGITFTSTGGLTISDSSKLESKLQNNLSEVEALFNSENGVAAVLYKQVEPYVGSEGYLSKANTSMGKTVTDISAKITSMQSRIDKNAEILRGKYEDLQMQLAQLLTTQGSYYSSE